LAKAEEEEEEVHYKIVVRKEKKLCKAQPSKHVNGDV
jgi:hypothetical protein